MNNTTEIFANGTSNASCATPHSMHSASEFFACYAAMSSGIRFEQLAELSLALTSVVANALCALAISYKSANFNVFDKILVNHCLIQGLTALVDIPIYHVQEVFGYFPCGVYAGLLWSIYDNSINTTTNLNMLYMCWARWRCIVAPGSFNSEFLIRNPFALMCLMWLVDLSLWSLVVGLFGLNEFSLSIDYRPGYVSSILNLVCWFVPLMLVFVVGALIIRRLYEFNARRKRLVATIASYHASQGHHLHIVNRHMSLVVNSATRRERASARRRASSIYNDRAMSPHIRFLLIIAIYWLQWIIPAVESIVSSTCQCVPDQMSRLFYWLTYFGCLTDPLVIFLLNPSIHRLLKRKMGRKRP